MLHVPGPDANTSAWVRWTSSPESGGAPMLRVTDGIILGNHEVEERFVRASGPGGQNLRKEETAVELRFDIAASSLPADVKQRLRVIAAGAVTTDGVLLVV